MKRLVLSAAFFFAFTASAQASKKITCTGSINSRSTVKVTFCLDEFASALSLISCSEFAGDTVVLTAKRYLNDKEVESINFTALSAFVEVSGERVMIDTFDQKPQDLGSKVEHWISADFSAPNKPARFQVVLNDNFQHIFEDARCK